MPIPRKPREGSASSGGFSLPEVDEESVDVAPSSTAASGQGSDSESESPSESPSGTTLESSPETSSEPGSGSGGFVLPTLEQPLGSVEPEPSGDINEDRDESENDPDDLDEDYSFEEIPEDEDHDGDYDGEYGYEDPDEDPDEDNDLFDGLDEDESESPEDDTADNDEDSNELESDEDSEPSEPRKEKPSKEKPGKSPKELLEFVSSKILGILAPIIALGVKLLDLIGAGISKTANLPLIGKWIGKGLGKLSSRGLRIVSGVVPVILLILLVSIGRSHFDPQVNSASIDLPDNGKVTISGVELHKGEDKVKATLKNEGDVIADAKGEVTVYGSRPLNPISWVKPKEIATCSMDSAVELQIDESKAVSMNCEAMKGFGLKTKAQISDDR